MKARVEAFTLIEAMLSTALMLVVMTQVAQVQRAARTALDRVRRPADWSSELAYGYGMFAADCAHFQNPAFLDPGADPNDHVLNLTQVTGDSTSASVDFYTAEYLPAGSQGIRRVTYKLEDGGLKRISSPGRESGARLQVRSSMLVNQVSELEVGLFDGKSYISSWAGKQGLPQGLRLRFLARDKQRYEWAHLFNGAMQTAAE